MRRWTGFRPARPSGSARWTMTDMEYSRKERSISSWISIGTMPTTEPPPPSPPPPGSAPLPFPAIGLLSSFILDATRCQHTGPAAARRRHLRPADDAYCPAPPPAGPRPHRPGVDGAPLDVEEADV